MLSSQRVAVQTQVFQAALARDGAVRAPFLDEACAGDRALRADADVDQNRGRVISR